MASLSEDRGARRDAPVPSEIMRMSERLSMLGTSPGDVLLACSLTALTLFDINSGTVVHVGLAVAVTVPVVMSLAWRRRAPAATLIAVCLLNLALSATATGDFPPQTILVTVLVAVASAATNLEDPRAVWLTGGGSLALIVAATAATGDGEAIDFLPYVIWAGPWLGGRLVRRRTQEVARLAAESALLVEQRETEAREAAARERDSIARELHDVVAHAVSLMVVQAGAERLTLGNGEQRTRAALEAIESSGREALQELRAMLSVLRDAPAPGLGSGAESPQPKLGDIPTLVGRVRDAGLPVKLSLPKVLPEVPAGIGLTAYRLVQEALTNALKHAGTQTAVTVLVDSESIQLEIRNPCPSVTPSSHVGRGLVGMRERVLLHGGDLSTGPESGDWVVRARLPLVSRTAVSL